MSFRTLFPENKIKLFEAKTKLFYPPFTATNSREKMNTFDIQKSSHICCFKKRQHNKIDEKSAVPGRRAEIQPADF